MHLVGFGSSFLVVIMVLSGPISFAFYNIGSKGAIVDQWTFI